MLDNHLLFSLSTYCLMSPVYTDAQVISLLRHFANYGSTFVRAFSMIERDGFWKFSPWTDRSLEKWDEDYFKRLDLILKYCKKYDMKLVWSWWVAQETILDHLPEKAQWEALLRLWEKVRERMLENDCFIELINEGDGEAHREMQIRMYRKLREDGVPPGRILFSSGAQKVFLGYWNETGIIFSPHSWCHLDNDRRLMCPYGMSWEDEVKRLKELQNEFGAQIVLSSDGCLFEYEEYGKKIFQIAKENNFGIELNYGWFFPPDHPAGERDWIDAPKILDIYYSVYGNYPGRYGQFPDEDPDTYSHPEIEGFEIISKNFYDKCHIVLKWKTKHAVLTKLFENDSPVRITMGENEGKHTSIVPLGLGKKVLIYTLGAWDSYGRKAEAKRAVVIYGLCKRAKRKLKWFDVVRCFFYKIFKGA